MLDLPGPGLEPVSPALAGRFLITAPPGKTPEVILKVQLLRKAGGARQVDPPSLDSGLSLARTSFILLFGPHWASWVTSLLIGLGSTPAHHPSYSPASGPGPGLHTWCWLHPHDGPSASGSHQLSRGLPSARLLATCLLHRVGLFP